MKNQTICNLVMFLLICLLPFTGTAMTGSFKILPDTLTANDIIGLEATVNFVSSECYPDSFSVHFESPTSIHVESFYTVGDATKPCLTVDTFYIGELEQGQYKLYFTGYKNLNQDSISDSLSFTVNATNRLRSNSHLLPAFDIYPNPVRDLLHVVLPDNLQVQSISLNNMQGRVLRTFDPGERQLDLSGLEAGQYLLTVTSSKGRLTERVVVW